MPQIALESELAGSQQAPSRAKGLCRLSVGLLAGAAKAVWPREEGPGGKGHWNDHLPQGPGLRAWS